MEDITVSEVEKQLKEMKATYYIKNNGYSAINGYGQAVWFIAPCFHCRFKVIPKTNTIKFEYSYFCGD